MVDVDVPLPRKRRVSVLLNDAAATPANDFYTLTRKDELRRFTFYPVLDVLIQGLNDWFSQETNSLICAVGRIVELNLGSQKWTNKDLEILQKYFNIDPDALFTELKILKSRKEEDLLPTNVR
uniref:Uncharacterized protein n=1 Tax=Graphocephala atropunctata TaxID=36148 RepID=A0A1B6LVG4_9HEMI